jgi:c-di-GMP-binding flagellar brake protein YcgR
MSRNPVETRKRKAAFDTGERLQVFERVSLRGQVLIHDENRLFIASVNNISAGGVFINELTVLPLGGEVRVVVKCPRLGVPIQAVGTVVRVENQKRRGLAVEFTSIASSDREAIQNCVFESRVETVLKVA